MKVTVTEVGTNKSETYTVSRDNWARRWACMRDGLVHMWLPEPPIPGTIYRTSGRIWHVEENNR